MLRRLIALMLLTAVVSPAAARKMLAPQGRPLPGGYGDANAGAPPPGAFLGAGGINSDRAMPGVVWPAPSPPHPSKAQVVELLEDDAGRLARALNSHSEATSNGSRAGAWGEDRFSGGCSLKVAGMQRYRERLPDWNYPIVETPKPGEYRYLRFAWKKPDDKPGIMLQLCVSGIEWGRYHAGANTVGWHPALSVHPLPPRQWQVVTRDLYADFGQVPFDLTGMAFTSMDGVAHFDHIYLARTIADLDKITAAVQKADARPEPIGTSQLDGLWKDLQSDDAAIRQPATWSLGNGGKATLDHVLKQTSVPETGANAKRIAAAVADLDSPRYALRERAAKELTMVGVTALPQLKAALREGISLEWQLRLEKLIAQCRGEEFALTAPQRTLLRTMHVLERANTPETKTMLEAMAKANLDAGLSLDAEGALARMKKRE